MAIDKSWIDFIVYSMKKINKKNKKYVNKSFYVIFFMYTIPCT